MVEPDHAWLSQLRPWLSRTNFYCADAAMPWPQAGNAAGARGMNPVRQRHALTCGR